MPTKITEKEYKKAVKAIKIVKSYASGNTAVKLIKNIGKIVTKFEKQNKSYQEVKKLNSQYNRLRARATKQSKDYEIISGEFSYAPNPFKKKESLGVIKYEGKKTLKILKNEITGLKNIWEANDLKVYSKDNNTKLLIKTALLSQKNYEEFFSSDTWQAIRKEEQENGEGYRSDLRVTAFVDKIMEYQEHNPKLFPEISQKRLNNILLKEFSKYDKEFPDEELAKTFKRLLKEGEYAYE